MKLISLYEVPFDYSDIVHIIHKIIKTPDDNHYIDLFRSSMSQYLNVKYVMFLGSGRESLRVILTSLDLSKGSEIICCAYDCIEVAKTIILHGSVPIFIDVDKDSFNIDFNYIEDYITDNKRVKYNWSISRKDAIPVYWTAIPAKILFIGIFAARYRGSYGIRGYF